MYLVENTFNVQVAPILEECLFRAIHPLAKAKGFLAQIMLKIAYLN